LYETSPRKNPQRKRDREGIEIGFGRDTEISGILPDTFLSSEVVAETIDCDSGHI
jgi:hypothetical protein